MKNISTALWYDKEALEAAELYSDLFRDSAIICRAQIHDTPSGSVDIVDIDLAGQHFTLISAGPMFSFNPSISFLVSCDSKTEIDRLNDTLSEGGQTLMPLDSYPFSDRYTWVQDRYGLSWQLYYNGGKSDEPYITPTLMFSGTNLGKAEAAMEFYASIFAAKGDSHVDGLARYGSEPAEREGMVMHGAFTLLGQTFYGMDSGVDHEHPFNEAISFSVNCDTQEEIDYYWSKLSAVPEAEQCGWLKDEYGLSWQIVPAVLAEMVRKGDEQQRARITQAFLQMKKFDLTALEKAWRNET